MQSHLPMLLSAFVLFCASTTQAQDVQVNRSNRTIQVTAREAVKVEPDLAQLHIGYRNLGATAEATVEQNVQVANKITKALRDAGVPKEAITTETIRVDRARDTEYGSNDKTPREFVASQEWIVTASISSAEKILELAIRTGANVVQEVTWAVLAPDKLREAANTAALQTARPWPSRWPSRRGQEWAKFFI